MTYEQFQALQAIDTIAPMAMAEAIGDSGSTFYAVELESTIEDALAIDVNPADITTVKRGAQQATADEWLASEYAFQREHGRLAAEWLARATA